MSTQPTHSVSHMFVLAFRFREKGILLPFYTRGGRWTSLDASFARCFAIF